MSEAGAFRAGLAVALASGLAVFGPALGLSPWWISLLVLLALGGLSLDAARYSGRGGHLLAEALPGGTGRLRRIAIHESGHLLQAAADQLPVRRVLVGSLACLRAGVDSGGCTEFELPATAKLPLPELRRWSRVLQAGGCAERLIYGECLGGADDNRLLGRLWGLSGYDVETAQREQRRARREVEQALRQQLQQLEATAEVLLQATPRLGRTSPQGQPQGEGSIPGSPHQPAAPIPSGDLPHPEPSAPTAKS